MADATVKRVKVELYGSSQSLQNAVQRAKDSLKGFDKQQQKTASFAGKLAKIMEYRLIRGGISKIIQGLEEGKKAIEAYDKALNGMSASKASSLMKEMAENTTLLHNTLASLFMTVYASVQPAINALVEALRGAMNMINQVISALIGRTTYTKAVKGWNSVTEAAKAYKKQIFGFDELNILKAPDGDNAPDYSGAFEETDINPILQGIAAMVQGIKPLIESIANAIDWDYVAQKVGEIGGLIALWKVSESLTGFIKSISGNPMYPIVVGVTLVVAGLEGLNEALWSAVSEGLTPDDVAKAMLSSGAIVLGGTMVGQALGSAVVGGLLGGFLVGATMLWNGIKGAFMDEYTPFEKFLTVGGATLMGAMIGAMFGPVGAGVGALIGLAVGLLTSNLLPKIKEKYGTLENYFETFKTNWITAFENLKKAISTIWDKLSKNLGQGFIDLKDSIVNTATELLRKVKEKFQPILDIIGKVNDGLGVVGGAFSSGLSSIKKVLGFANGGFPTQGDLFIANEAGPEFVGSFGNRTGVYNQEQFAGAMASANAAVVQAVYAIGSQITGAVNNKPVPSVKIGDRDIFSASQRGATLAGSSLIQGGRS